MRRLPLLRGFVNAKCISRFDYSTMPFSISFMKRTTDLLGYQWYAAKLYTVKTSRITGASDNDISLRFFVACSAARTGNNRTSTSNGNASHTFAKFTGEFLSNSKTHFKTSLQFKSARKCNLCAAKIATSAHAALWARYLPLVHACYRSSSSNIVIGIERCWNYRH